jgi:hypothetical protein
MIIIIAGIIDPMNALNTIVFPEAVMLNDTPMMIADTAPKHAPDEIPVLYGSARGLFIKDCINVPAAASDAPAIIATAPLGIARFQI